jgi:hypothetical protein
MTLTPNRRVAVTSIIARVIGGIVVMWAFGTALFLAPTHGQFC